MRSELGDSVSPNMEIDRLTVCLWGPLLQLQVTLSVSKEVKLEADQSDHAKVQR